MLAEITIEPISIWDSIAKLANSGPGGFLLSFGIMLLVFGIYRDRRDKKVADQPMSMDEGAIKSVLKDLGTIKDALGIEIAKVATSVENLVVTLHDHGVRLSAIERWQDKSDTVATVVREVTGHHKKIRGGEDDS